MRTILLAFLAGIGLSQTVDDTTKLIQEVADTAKNAASWQIEGSISYAESGTRTASSEQFKILMRSPDKTRFEQMGKSTPAIIVCDGPNPWVYSPPLRRYRNEPSTANKLCSPIVGDWKLLPTSLQSPVLAGSCGPNPSIQSPDYKWFAAFQNRNSLQPAA